MTSKPGPMFALEQGVLITKDSIVVLFFVFARGLVLAR
jgi:hypothetical protein